MSISQERNTFVVAERFLSDILDKYDKYSDSIDEGSWYPQACKFLILNHHIIPLVEKALSKGPCSA